MPVIPVSHFDARAQLCKRDNTIHAVLNKLFEHRDIAIEDKLYLRRWYISGRGTGKQVFLHHIVRPDGGRELHDHPWNFTTRILSGGYYEQVLDTNSGGVCSINGQWHIGGDRVSHAAEYTHRIDKVLDGTYTLVTAAGARREWGFYVNQRRRDGWTSALAWIPSYEYVGLAADHPRFPEDVIRGEQSRAPLSLGAPR